MEEYLPANPGSRFVSIGDVRKMAAASATPASIGADEVKLLAADIDKRFTQKPLVAPNYAQAGRRYYSLAEAFLILARSLAGMDGSNVAWDRHVDRGVADSVRREVLEAIEGR